MSLVLRNNRLELQIDEPGQVYKMSRFDYTGKISQVILDSSYSFCSQEILNGFDKEKSGRGLYNEFGISDPVGFDDCKPGEQFLKIGVGLLTRPDDKPYDFMRLYEISPCRNDFIAEESWVKFSANPLNCRGYEVKYTKLIKLNNNSFTIQYEIQNTGSKIINTSEYCHNFIAINRSFLDENYTLKFPFKIDRSAMDEIVNPEDVIAFKDKRMIFRNNVTEEFFFSHLEYENGLLGMWEITNDKHGVGVRETTDFVPSKINIWGWKHVVSPELFCKISIEPGQTMTWQRKFEFYYL
jgi:hypothetical protein